MASAPSPVLVCALLFKITLSGAETFESNGQSTFPSDVPSNTTILKIIAGSFASMDPTDLDGLPLLWKLEIRQTPLSGFPDVRAVSGSLTALHLEHTQISAIVPDYLAALDKLAVLEISYSPLLDFPAVDGLSSLISLSLFSTSLTCAPHLGTYPSLEIVSLLSNADLDFCTGNELRFLSKSRLQRLEIKASPSITRLPSLEDVAHSLEAMEVAATGLTILESFTLPPLKIITDLKLATSQSLQRVPPLCMQDFSGLTMWMTQIDLCRCENLWVKLFQSMDPGRHAIWTQCSKWAASSLDDLLLGCSTVDEAYKYHNVTIISCLDMCAQTPACYYFNFRMTDDSSRLGHCVLVAPHSGLQPNIHDWNADGWMFYEIDYYD